MTVIHPEDGSGGKYVENETLTIPVIQDGPTGIGDIWDCHTSTSVGFNLFGTSLTPAHIQADKIQDFKYTLSHIKSSKDKHKALNVKGEVSLELLSGLIKVSGGAEYDNDMETSSTEEELMCTYDVVTYYVRAIPAAKQVLDPLVVEKLLKGEIKGTHLVSGMYLGGNMNASLRIKETNSSNKEDIKGNLFGKLTYGPVSASVKISLGVLDTSKANDYEKHIQVVSRPAIKQQPSTVQGMFEVVESIGGLVEKEKYLSHVGLSDVEVYGVPIRFKLVPISQFLDVPVEKLYMQIKDTTLEKLTELFVFLKDIQVYRFLSRRILEREPRMKRLLLDPNNPLSKEVAINEKAMLELAQKSYVEAAEALKSYKVNEIDQNYLLELATKIGQQLNIGNILQDVNNYIQNGRKELLGIHQGDIDETHQIKIFTNETDLEEWYQPTKPIKILFRTSGPSASSNVISSLYDISGPLGTLGIELGVALPNVSNFQYNLSIKVDGSPQVYKDDMIPHVIDVLHLLVGKASPLSMRFFTIFSTIRGIKLPFHSHLKDLHNLIKVLREVQHVTIAESYLQFRDYLQGDAHKLKLAINLGAVESAAEAVRAFSYLSSIHSDIPGDWIVGQFGFESCSGYSNAPLIFIFKNEKLVASCFDTLDVLLLHETLLQNSRNQEEPGNVEWTLLEVSRANLEKNCFHRERGNFALKTASMFESTPTIMEADPKLEKLPGFANEIECDPQVTFTSLIFAGFCQFDREAMVTGLGNIVITAFPALENYFNDNGWIKDNHSKILVAPANTDFTPLITSLESFLQNQNPFSFKISQAISILHEFKENPDSQKELITKYISGIKDDPDCPEPLKNQLEMYLEIPSFAGTIAKIISELEKYLQSSGKPEFRQCLLLIALLKLGKGEDVAELRKFVEFTLLPNLVVDLAVDDSKHPQVAAQIQKCQHSQDLYGVLGLLATLKMSPLLFTLTKLLTSFMNIDDKNALHNLVNGPLSKTLDEQQHRTLFANQKVQLLLERASKHQDFLEKVKFYHCPNDIVPDYLPSFLRAKLKELVSEEWKDEFPEELQNVDQVIGVFMRIANCSTLPENFSKVLRSSLETNPVLLNAFRDANALYHYDEAKHEFTEAWDCDTVRKVHEDLVAWKDAQNAARNPQNQPLELDLSSSLEASHGDGPAWRWTSVNPLIINDDIPDCDGAKCTQGVEKSKLLRMMGPGHLRISQTEFIRVGQIKESPLKRRTLENGFMAKLMPYIIQRLKMWGVHVLDPTNLSQFVDLSAATPSSSLASHTSAPRRLIFGKKQPPANLNVTRQNDVESHSNCANIAQNPISRLDFLATLFSICNPLVFQDLVKVMSQFPVALPFILPNIGSEGSQTYTCLLPLLKVITVKWETGDGIVKYNQLFTDPFKLIVAIRLGVPEAKKPGKSTILNQMLSSRHVFSSLSDPGSEMGKPLSLDGSVELCILSEETCSLSLFQAAVKDHYSKDANQVLLLANVHGDARDYPDTIKLLKKYASSFVVFFMPMSKDSLSSNGAALEEEFLIDPEQTVHLLVDPTPECEELLPDIVIKTSQLTSDTTLQVVRNVLADAINSKSDTPLLDHEVEIPTDSGSVTIFPEIATPESTALVRFINGHGVGNVKASLQLQKINSRCGQYGSAFFNIWENDEILRKFITLFIKLLSLPIEYRLVALAHLDREISALSAKESTAVRARIAKLQEQKRRSVSLEDSVHVKSQIQIIDDQINEGFRELDAMTLGLENIYREVARVFQMAQSSSSRARGIIDAARHCGETLIQGQAIEVLDGEGMEVCGAWFNAVCHTVCQQFKDLKIFVLSIIGLQSSGKSTLLNALFACKFAVSVGRCTRGLFLRLLFLEDDLATELGVDAILILDTEGLGAPEKLNDSNAEQKDRILATFAMSLSNLTLINVLGESLRDLTDILQIVVVTLARLEKADISPDILMVQHLSERDSSKTMQGVNEFCEALKEAVSLTDKQDMNIGVRNCQSLRRLEQRLKKNELLHQFPPFKNGATVNAPPSRNYHDNIVTLYKVILDSIKATQNPQVQTFHKWHERVQSYWDAVSTQDFALRFKNIKEVQDFISRGVLIAKVKEAVDGAFRTHRDNFEASIRQKVNELTSFNKDAGFNWAYEKGILLESIKNGLKRIPLNCPQTCDMCRDANNARENLFLEVKHKSCETTTQTTIQKYVQASRDDMMKHFNQMSEALVINHGCIAEIDSIILKKLEEKVKIKSDYSELEVQQIVNEIWRQVTQIYSQKLTVVSAERQIQQEVYCVYEAAEAVALDVAYYKQVNLGKLEAIDHGFFKKHIARKDRRLAYNQVCVLQESLHQLPSQILREYATDHFETGMCARLRAVIDKTIEDFEKASINGEKLTPEFKWKVHVYAIKHFKTVMKQRDEEWNKVHNPLYILRAKEDKYKQEMGIRLRDGFGFEAEGKIVGGTLLKAIRLHGQKFGDWEHVAHIRQNGWLTGSENVRLEYFKSLATQVSDNRKEPSLRHFKFPKVSINEWFANQVDSISKEKGRGKFLETVTSEYNLVVHQIRNSTSYSNIVKYVQTYLTNVEGMEYNPKADLTSSSKVDFQVFQTAILRKLQEGNESTLKLDIEITNPSENIEVKKLLGCTEGCPFCGALCWGEYGHETNDDNTKKHHACHQPQGLVGVHVVNSRYGRDYLQPLICDAMDETGWTFLKIVDGRDMLWRDVKLHQNYCHWLYTSHNRNEFNELMKWFFVELQQELASDWCVGVTPQVLLREKGFLSIQGLTSILSTINSKIGSS